MENYSKARYPNDVLVYSDELVDQTLVSGSTPFAFYDSDIAFQTDAPKAAKFIARRLGYPLMDVELQPINIYACFEEAVTTYGNQVYSYKVRENYLSLEGSLKGANGSANDQVVEPTLQRVVEIARNYGTEADVGGVIELHHDLLELKEGQQDYDLNAWAESLGIDGGIEIRRVFYEAPPAILRYFDPYAGTGTGVQSLMDAFDFGSYSPGVNFLLMPVSFDVLKIQAIEFNDQVRKSAYSFRISNNKLSIFPIPTMQGHLRIEYYKLDDKRKLSFRDKELHTQTHTVYLENIPSGSVIPVQHMLGLPETELNISCEVQGKGFAPRALSFTDENELVFEASVDIPKGSVTVSYLNEYTADDTVYKTSNVDFDVKLLKNQQFCTQRFTHYCDTKGVQVKVYHDEGTEAVDITDQVEINRTSNFEVYVTFHEDTKGHIVFKAEESTLDSGVITNVSEVPYTNPTYNKINSIGRQWIFKYALALCKEVLAYVRGKYTQLPIPDSEATLNQADLLADARTEKEKLTAELTELLQTSSRPQQLENKAKETENLKTILAGVPVGIWVG